MAVLKAMLKECRAGGTVSSYLEIPRDLEQVLRLGKGGVGRTERSFLGWRCLMGS
jgi:hypothetical protein